MTTPQWILHGPGTHDRAVCDTAETWCKLFTTIHHETRYPRGGWDDEKREALIAESNRLLHANKDVADLITIGEVGPCLMRKLAAAYEEMNDA